MRKTILMISRILKAIIEERKEDIMIVAVNNHSADLIEESLVQKLKDYNIEISGKKGDLKVLDSRIKIMSISKASNQDFYYGRMYRYYINHAITEYPMQKETKKLYEIILSRKH